MSVNTTLTDQKVRKLAEQFLSEEILEICVYGNGHINDTFLVHYKEAGKEKKMIIQHINKKVFRKPVELMENIESITSFLQRKIQMSGGDVNRETLTIIPVKNKQSYYEDEDGEFWRAYLFIDGGICYEQVEKIEDFYESAVAFGNFQRLLSDYPAETLHESIPGFHNTKKRFAAFVQSVKEDKAGRAAEVQEEIRFILDREEVANCFADLLEKGEIPLRVTHNDTKLNNIMMDEKTGKGLCVLDLDTVMPGLVMHDFGDAIRFGASTAAEDEKDLTKVSCDLELYEIYVKGFLKGAGDALTEKEISLFPMGAKVLAYEQGMRFLTDYLDGDVYYKISREGQNLDRARTQLKLVADMEEKWERMKQIVEEQSKKLK